MVSDLISRCELFNRLAPVQTLGEAYSIIQGMPTVEINNDIISRQAAIDALSCENPTETYIDYDDAVKAIRRLHSAEPETHEKRTETHECDLISRKDAIDAFLTELTKRERKNLLHTWSTVEVKYFVVEMLEQLPSAQSEITECPMCPDCPDNCPLEVEDD